MNGASIDWADYTQLYAETIATPAEQSALASLHDQTDNKKFNELVTKCANIIYTADSSTQLQYLLEQQQWSQQRQERPRNDDGEVKSFDEICNQIVPKTDRTVLMTAAKCNRPNCCKYLLDNCSNPAVVVNHQNQCGFTALHYACFHGHRKVALQLLQFHADVSLQNEYGENPIQSAVTRNHCDLADELLAELQHRDGGGQFQGTDDLMVMSITKATAAEYFLRITAVDGSDSNQNLLNKEFCCWPTADQQHRHQLLLQKHSIFTSAAWLAHAATTTQLTIGRSVSNSIQIADISLSKQHAVVSFVEGQGFVVQDLGSKHGTYLDGKRIDMVIDSISSVTEKKRREDGEVLEPATPPLRSYELKEGSRLRFGRVHAVVVRKKHSFVSKTHGSNNNVEGTVEQHQKAVRQRVQVLLTAAGEWPIGKDIPSHKSNSRTTEIDRSESRKRKASAIASSSDSAAIVVERNQPICKPAPQLEGRALLMKYGWEEGSSLGRQGGAANTPMEPVMRAPRAGLGSATSFDSRFMTLDVRTKQKREVWEKTAARYAMVTSNSCQNNARSPKDT